jgi:hypothetical protein
MAINVISVKLFQSKIRDITVKTVRIMTYAIYAILFDQNGISITTIAASMVYKSYESKDRH